MAAVIKRRILPVMMTGVVVLLVMHILYVFVLWDAQKYELLRLLLLIFPVLAAFLVAYWAPYRKFVSAMAMSLFGTAIGVASLPVYQFAGLYIDSIGGLSEIFVIYFCYHALLSALGGLGGIFVTNLIEKLSK